MVTCAKCDAKFEDVKGSMGHPCMSGGIVIGTAWTGTYFAEIVSVNDGTVLVRNTSTGEQEDVTFSALQDVWPAPQTLEAFDDIAREFGESFTHSVIVALTGTEGWADLLRAKWSELY